MRPTANSSLIGLALSGGGVRSASFCLGALQALDKAGVLQNVDYLSTVSGGGYIGTSLSAAMTRSEGQFPFTSSQTQDEPYTRSSTSATIPIIFFRKGSSIFSSTSPSICVGCSPTDCSFCPGCCFCGRHIFLKPEDREPPHFRHESSEGLNAQHFGASSIALCVFDVCCCSFGHSGGRWRSADGPLKSGSPLTVVSALVLIALLVIVFANCSRGVDWISNPPTSRAEFFGEFRRLAAGFGRPIGAVRRRLPSSAVISAAVGAG